MRNLYQEVTDAILGSVDAAGDWKPCWQGAVSLPRNGVTNRRYNGINILILWMTSAQRGYAQARWATYQQWKDAGCQVRKGEKGTGILLFKTHTKNEGTSDEQSYRVARSFTVFNADQVDGEKAQAPIIRILNEDQRHARADHIVLFTGAEVLTRGNQPCYVPKLDEIWMPSFRNFHSAEAYYGTLFHELGHWTGHKDRLNRELSTRFKTASYGMEELVAELTSAFLCAEVGIAATPRADHAAYLKSWRDTMKADNSAIIAAASAASAAADFVLQFSTDAELEEAA